MNEWQSEWRESQDSLGYLNAGKSSLEKSEKCKYVQRGKYRSKMMVTIFFRTNLPDLGTNNRVEKRKQSR